MRSRGSSALGAARGIDAPAVGARASSNCRSRQSTLGLREAHHRDRSGRKPAPVHGAREREPDHARPHARKRRSPREANGGWSFGVRRSSSRERRGPREVVWFRPRVGAGGVCMIAVGRRHLGSEKRTPFTRPPRNRSRRPSRSGAVLASRQARRRRGEEATGVSEAIAIELAQGTTTSLRRDGRSPKWGSRREARLSPVSSCTGRPRASRCPRCASPDGRRGAQINIGRCADGHEPRGSVRG